MFANKKNYLLPILSLVLFSCAQTQKLIGGPALNLDGTPPGYDDGAQMENPFRINYAGYLPRQDKIAVYITEFNQEINWQVVDQNETVIAQGTSGDYRSNDRSSGDSFYLIDFSSLRQYGTDYRLKVGNDLSKTFEISDNPYGNLKYEFFDYFKDHRRSGDVFDRYVHNWNDYSVSFNFVADAGDQGYYPVNAAEAQWAMISMLEQYPEANEFYSSNVEGMATVYDELVFMNDPMDKIIIPGQKLAIAKWHTNSNLTWALCPGARGISGSCVSRPASKATYSVARTLAAMSRIHIKNGNDELGKAHFNAATSAFENAESEKLSCLTPTDVGGEGGYYPNNDNWSLWREPRTHRDPCISGPEVDPKDYNINDDQYAAIAELYLAAEKFGRKKAAIKYKDLLEVHAHHNRIDQFWWHAVSPEATISLLINSPQGLNLSIAKENLFAYSDQILEYQEIGYPGVTFDTQSDIWNTGDNDEIDNNWRWGSNRLQLNDARILGIAAELALEAKDYDKAITYTNAVLKVMDQISGTNAVALAMYTARNYPHIDHAVSRTHDALVPDTEDGKMALGPNNWTNSNDPHMPAFGSKPGMKMFALTGTGWASREISVDGNGSLVPVAYFATERAPIILEQAYTAQK